MMREFSPPMRAHGVMVPLLALLAVDAAMAQPYRASVPVRLLAAHNAERARWGLRPLQWHPALAASAAAYGPTLAYLGRLQHSPRASRPGQAENLWMGSRGSYSVEQMVGGWLSERSDFRPGVFPYVSRDGNWLSVSHYSQIVWPTTTRVGCAIQTSRWWDFLICRYSPKGNRDGQRVP